MSEEFDKQFSKLKSFLEGNFIINDSKIKGILAAINEGIPIMLVGPTGTGKTHLLTLLKEYFKGEYEYASLNGAITINELTQERVLSKDGTFEEQDGVLATWLRKSKKGISILHLDEVNAARPETLLALHPIMDIKGELRMPYTGEILKVTKNAVLVMSANEGDEYTGINAMNMAFQNRYVKVHLSYIQGEQLVTHLTNKTGINKKDCTAIVRTWEKYMGSREPDQPVVSIRLLERWATMANMLGLKEAGIITFASHIASSEEHMAEIVESDLFVNLGGHK